AMQGVTLREELLGYIVDIVHTTRRSDTVLVGAGPRATQALVLGARAQAAMDERDFVTPDDVKALARPVLGHRLILRPEHEIEGVTVEEVIAGILQEVTVPR
ncbi:MAG: magnesium chelatase, partial [Lentisphaeria bacterium]|nr:magnesium chelatase [Lentisphaeria bacterium]